MVKLATAGGIAGAWFVVWQLWSMRRKAQSTSNYDFARAHPSAALSSPTGVFAAQREANGAPDRLLSVSAFSLANLNVSAAAGFRGVGPHLTLAPSPLCRRAADSPSSCVPTPPSLAAGEASAAQRVAAA